MRWVIAAIVVGSLVGCKWVSPGTGRSAVQAKDVVGNWVVETVWDGKAAHGILLYDEDGFFRFELATTEGPTEQRFEAVGIWRLAAQQGKAKLVMNGKYSRYDSRRRPGTEDVHRQAPITAPRVTGSELAYEMTLSDNRSEMILTSPDDFMSELRLRREVVKVPARLMEEAH